MERDSPGGASRLEIVRLLLEAGANPGLPNAAGQTPAMLAEPYPEVKQLLQKSR